MIGLSSLGGWELVLPAFDCAETRIFDRVKLVEVMAEVPVSGSQSIRIARLLNGRVLGGIRKNKFAMNRSAVVENHTE